MTQDIFQNYQNYMIRRKRRNVLKKVVNVLACVVIFCTTYALILPAITMEKETFCGFKEHTHVEDCYSVSSQTQLICTAEKLDIHAHSEDCFDDEERLICTQADYIAHVHADNCADAEGNIVCTLTEQETHIHTDNCYAPVETMDPIFHVHGETCIESQKGELICTLEEYEGHTHGDACYVPLDQLLCTVAENHSHSEDCYTYSLICTESDVPHCHTVSCYSLDELVCDGEEDHVHEISCVKPQLICENDAAEHTHDDNCYGPVSNCGKEEGDVHSHGTDCYSAEATLICQEAENHTHDDHCHQLELQCTIAEEPGHIHADECYEWKDVLICQLEEGDAEPTEPVDPVLICTEPIAQIHVHDEACFETITVDPVPVCEHTSEDHVHGIDCYELDCGLEEHTHSLGCYSDPEADIEDAALWESTFADIELTGEWSEDVLAIATTQLGYEESTKNYLVREDDTTQGYTRYGAWYGIPHGDWCAMFVSFCLDYAEVEGMPLHSVVVSWIEELTELKLYHNADVYEPKAGDLIFFDWQGDDISDHVGLVCEIIPETDTEPAKIKTIEGNSGDRVQYCEYDLNSEQIFGYSELPDNIEVYSCGILRHAHNEYCIDSDSNFACQQIAHEHTDACIPRNEVYCGLEEHVHAVQCYNEAGDLFCVLSEHIHNEFCAVETTDDEMSDSTGEVNEHIHVEECYNEAGELICQSVEDIHAEEYDVEAVSYFCGQEIHVHADGCYNEAGEMICELTDHSHTDECLSKKEVQLCGMEAHIHDNTCHSETGELLCEITEHTHTEGCREQNCYVCGQIEHTHAENCYDKDGNFVCDLAEHNHTDVCKGENVYTCGMMEHTHNEICCDETGNSICEISEHLHTVACVGRNLYYSDAAIRVHAVIHGVENLPQKLRLVVQPVVQEENPDEFGSMQVAVSQEMSGKEQYLSTASFYNLYLLSDGVIYELPENASVTVTMEFSQPVFNPEDIAESVGTHAFMLNPQDGMQLPASLMDTDDESISDAIAEEEKSSIVDSFVNSVGEIFSSIVTPAMALDDISQIEVDTSDDSDDTSVDYSYNVSTVTGENYGSQEQGITSITFQTNRLATFGIALANETMTGSFWERIDSTDDIVSGGTYMIVSAEGGYALTGNNNTNYQAVKVETVKGNTQYYTISGSADNNLRWTIERSGNSYIIRNQGTSNYLCLANSTFISSTSANSSLSYIEPENCWRIFNGSYYLRNQGTGVFTRAETNDKTGNNAKNDGNGKGTSGSTVVFYYTRDMLIFKLSSVTSLEIPSDVTGSDSSGDSGNSQNGPEKPNYPDIIVPSGSKTGDTALISSTASVSGKYYSDPATSDLETNYRKTSYAASEAIDGKVMSDKSVIYKDDDYNAFSYTDNTFGVTMSVLGQEYPVPQTDVIRTPIDVVFVLDVSGSMSANAYQNEVRADAMSEAFNSAVTAIMKDHPANRVGMVMFSTGAWEILPLDRYTADDLDGDGIMDLTTIQNKEKYNISTKHYVVGSDTLKNDSGTSFKEAGLYYDVNGSEIIQGVGTFTQGGIAMGEKVFRDIGSDTTYTATIGEGEDAREYTVKRQPVFILLSDGEPTHATNIFMDALNGPFYGDGQSSTGNTNAKGILGYYTVLTANYSKRMVGIQYNREALFYTIGMGIKTPNDEDDDTGYTETYTKDRYKRAVLNPDPEIIKDLYSDRNNTTTTLMLKQLLMNDYSDQSVELTSQWPDTWIGVPHKQIPALQANPYTDDYSYADGAYFGQMTADDLSEIFESIINSSVEEKPYGFVLYQNTSVQMTDYIGAGMEIKGTPVLRYAGVNYTNPTVTTEGNTTTYTYSGTYQDPYIPNRAEVDLAGITVMVTQEPHVPIYMCGLEEHTHDEECAKEFNNNCQVTEHTHTESDCGIYWSYLCGHHAHQPSCYTDGNLTCDDPHEHTDKCKKITTTQRIVMTVPDHLLPVYSPELVGKQYYYEALPVRLIYQVGLTSEAQQAVLDLAENGGELTFYTNRWGGSQHARSDLLPSLVNPFYYDQDKTDSNNNVPYDEHSELKTSNVTGTAAYYTQCHWGSTEYEDQHLGHVYHELGNNGKLVFEAETIDIPVEKKWQSDSTKDVSFTLYKVVADANGRLSAESLETITLNAEGNWQGSFTKKAMPPADDSWYYAVSETVPDGYAVSYDGDTVDVTVTGQETPVTMVKVSMTGTTPNRVIITNSPSTVLPETGGSGTILYTTGGIALITVAILFLLYNKKARREEHSFL